MSRNACGNLDGDQCLTGQPKFITILKQSKNNKNTNNNFNNNNNLNTNNLIACVSSNIFSLENGPFYEFLTLPYFDNILPYTINYNTIIDDVFFQIKKRFRSLEHNFYVELSDELGLHKYVILRIIFLRYKKQNLFTKITKYFLREIFSIGEFQLMENMTTNLNYEFLFTPNRYKSFINDLIFNFSIGTNQAIIINHILLTQHFLNAYNSVPDVVRAMLPNIFKVGDNIFNIFYFKKLFIYYNSNIYSFSNFIIYNFCGQSSAVFNETAAEVTTLFYSFNFIDSQDFISNFSISTLFTYYYYFSDLIDYKLLLLQMHKHHHIVSILYNPHRSNIFFDFLFNILGSISFILSGGESNPGPIVSWVFDLIKITLRNALTGSMTETVNLMSTLSDMGVMSMYLMRIFTSFSDLLSSLLFRTVSMVEVTTRLTSIILNVYETYKKYGARLRVTARPQVGPYETLLATSLLSMTAPSFVKKILKDMPSFTHTKILDDFSIFNEIFGFFISIPRRMLQFFDYDDTSVFKTLDDALYKMECIFPFSQLGSLKCEMEKMTEQIRANPSIILVDEFQKSFLELDKKRKVLHEECMVRRGSLPTYMKNIDVVWKEHSVRISNLLDNVRVEPLCVILQGPPGTGKSTLLGLLVRSLTEAGNGVYYDTIPASVENKHFFDAYDNQDIYVVDDIGARAKAQWSELVNMVSCSKYPLEAAEIKNKNLKYFNSKLILGTCNILPHNFSSTDGVAEKEALYRRLNVLNFDHVIFDTTTGTHKGKIWVTTYDGTLGVREFVCRQIIDLDKADGYSTIMQYIEKELENKFDIYKRNKLASIGVMPARRMPHARPQVGFEEFVQGMKNSMPDFIDSFMDLTVQGLTAVLDGFNFIKGSIEQNNLVVVCLLIAAIIVGLIVYYVKLKYDERSKDDVSKQLVNKQYVSTHVHKKQFKNVVNQGLVREDREIVAVDPQLLPISRAMCDLIIQFTRIDGERRISVRGMISGNRVITVAHIFGDQKQGYMTLKRNGVILYECVPFEVQHVIRAEDIAFIKLDDILPRLAKVVKIPLESNNNTLYLASTPHIIALGRSMKAIDFKITYSYENYDYLIDESDVCYDHQADGMCGSLLINGEGFIFGMHVAAIDHDEGTSGVAKLWNDSTAKVVSNFLAKATPPNLVMLEERNKIGQSGTYLEARASVSAPAKTTYVESLVHGVFPTLRKPALEIEADRKNPGKLLQQYLEPTPDATLQVVDAAGQTLDTLLKPGIVYPVLNEREIVFGGEGMSRINPKTSSGYIYEEKSVYLDYDKGLIKPEGKRIVVDLVNKMKGDEYDFEDFAILTPKDELKNIRDLNDTTSLPEKIRVFTNYHLVQTILFRFFLGNFLSAVSADRHQNGIMVGINPFSEEWNTLSNNVLRFGRKIFDGDYKHFDRHMHPLFQRVLHKVIKARVSYDEREFNRIFGTSLTKIQLEKVFDTLMETIISTPIVAQGKRILTTHGLPSGTAVTAIYNSFINKMYTYYAYYKLVPMEFRTKSMCLNYMYTAVYGDDVLGSVRADLRSYFNPIAFAKVMQGIGLDFTPADKGEWNDEKQWKELADVSFLKRKFYFHPGLKRVVAPLDQISMESTLNYVKDDNRNLELTMDKVVNYQREAYLHGPSYYDGNIKHVKEYANNKGVGVILLDESDLVCLYNKGEYSLVYSENFYQ